MKRQSKKQSKDKQPPKPPFPLWTVKKESSDIVDVILLADFAQASIPLDNSACLYVGEERQLCQQSLALGIQNYICLLYMTFLLHFMSVEIWLPKLGVNAGVVNRSSISKSIIFKLTHRQQLDNYKIWKGIHLNLCKLKATWDSPKFPQQFWGAEAALQLLLHNTLCYQSFLESFLTQIVRLHRNYLPIFTHPLSPKPTIISKEEKVIRCFQLS